MPTSGSSARSLGHRKRLLAGIENGREEPVSPEGGHSTGRATPGRHLIRRSVRLHRPFPSLDAEQVHELVARFTSLVDRIIAAYGGSVDKHIGDAVMALFGAPRAHDDDPLRAARAAIDIHEAMARWNDSPGRPPGPYRDCLRRGRCARPPPLGRARLHGARGLGEPRGATRRRRPPEKPCCPRAYSVRARPRNL